MKLSPFFSRVKNILTAPLPVAGLEISATSLKYLLVKNQTIVQASLRLPPGIIVHGEVKDRKSLIAALKNLHAQVTTQSRPVTVVLNLPSSGVFTQAFSVPMVDAEHLEESIRLNLQMISPNKIEDSYYDWQEIKINKDLGHLDLLGAFANRKVLDEFTSCAKEANFNLVAVEFPGLALARLIRERWGGLEKQENYLLVYINGEGLLLVILKNGNVYFNHFTSWELATAGKELTGFEQVREFFAQEVQRVMNFYLGRSGKNLTEAILISPVFNYEVVKLLSEKLNLKIRNLSIAELPKLQPNWFPALGTGLRGIIPRSKDTDITLTESDAQKEYYDERTIMFTTAWRNIIVGAMVFLLAAFVAVDTLLTKEAKRLETKVATEFSTKDPTDSKKTQEQIAYFNQQLDFVEKVASQEISWSPFMELMNTLAGNDVILEHITANKTAVKNVLTGRAQSEQAAINFKNRLIADPRFKNISLPLADLTVEPDKSVTFNLSFEVTM